MAKDPAILFYPEAFITGTIFMSDEEVGKYIKLLCYQHQHGGMVDKTAFDSIALDSKLLRSKFIETEDGYFNERLMNEMEKRAVKSTNLSANAKKRWDKVKEKKCKRNAIASASHMPSKDTNKDKDKTKVKKQYTNNVSMTEKEYQHLLSDYFDGKEDILKKAIDKLDAYKESNGKQYKSDAGAIRSWVAREIMNEDKPKEIVIRKENDYL